MAENEKKQGRIARFFRDLKSERKKITWPTKQETLKKSWVVMVVLVVLSAIIGLLDLGFSKLILLLADLF